MGLKGFDLKSRAYNWISDKYIKGKYRDYVFPEYIEVIQYLYNTSISISILSGYEKPVSIASPVPVPLSDYDSLPSLFFSIRDHLIQRINKVLNRDK